MTKNGITKKDFDKVIASVRSGITNKAAAKATGFSIETVRIIRKTGTWKKFKDFKTERNARYKAKNAKRVSGRPTAEAKFQKALDKVQDKQVTPEYVQELLDSMQEQKLATEALIEATDKHTKAIQTLDESHRLQFSNLRATIRGIKRIWWSRR